jgi:hypothetical protein
MKQTDVKQDPIFDLIEAHRDAWRELGKVIDKDARREAELGKSLCGLEARLRKEPAATLEGLRAKVDYCGRYVGELLRHRRAYFRISGDDRQVARCSLQNKDS